MPARPSVLMVEDSGLLRELFKHTLASLGCDMVGEAATQKDAIRLFKSLSPDLVLMDIRLAIGDGIEAAREILTFDPDAYVVMLTSMDERGTHAKCLELGAKGFITKGRSADELIGDIQCHLVDLGLPLELPESASSGAN